MEPGRVSLRVLQPSSNNQGLTRPETEHDKVRAEWTITVMKYTQGFGVLCFVVIILSVDFGLINFWGRDKMAAIFQTTFSNEFSWMKMYEFR